MPRLQRSGEQPRIPAHHHLPDRPFAPVIIQRQRAIIHESAQFRFVRQRILYRLMQRRTRRAFLRLHRQPAPQRIQLRPRIPLSPLPDLLRRPVADLFLQAVQPVDHLQRHSGMRIAIHLI